MLAAGFGRGLELRLRRWKLLPNPTHIEWSGVAGEERSCIPRQRSCMLGLEWTGKSAGVDHDCPLSHARAGVREKNFQIVEITSPSRNGASTEVKRASLYHLTARISAPAPSYITIEFLASMLDLEMSWPLASAPYPFPACHPPMAQALFPDKLPSCHQSPSLMPTLQEIRASVNVTGNTHMTFESRTDRCTPSTTAHK